MNEQLQTPYYVVHKELVDKQLNLLKEALNTFWDSSLIAYSYKTNSLPWLVDYYNRNGCYAEVVSDDEYYLGKQIGVAEDRFVYNGPIKTKETFLEALSAGCIVNIDAYREIEWLDELSPQGTYRLGIRVNFDIEKECPHQSACGEDGGRFGFCYENGNLQEAIEAIQNKGFNVTCLHMHTSSKTRAIDIYRTIAKKACEIAKRYNLKLSYLDVGGGYFGGLDNRPQFADYLREITAILAGTFDKRHTTLIVEPGMSLVGPTVSYVTSVIDVKDTTYGRFVVTDGSRTNIDPLMSKTSYFLHLERATAGGRILPKQVICGYTCMEHDRLFHLENDVELMVGDHIVYHKVGAYTMCLSPLFIRYFPSVYLETDKGYQLIRSRWHAEEYCQRSIFGGCINEYPNSQLRHAE